MPRNYLKKFSYRCCMLIANFIPVIYIFVNITINNNIIVKLTFQFSSVAHSCLTLCNPMNRSMPGLLVHHQLPEFTQTHVHQVRDAIQPSHPGPPFFSCPLRGPTWETLKKKLCGLELRWLLEDEMRAWPKFVKTFDWLS